MKLNLLIEQEELEQIHKQISINIKRIRQNKKMSQLEVATYMGFKSSTFYGNAENNLHGKHFNIEHIFMLARLFQIPATKLIDIEGFQSDVLNLSNKICQK